MRHRRMTVALGAVFVLAWCVQAAVGSSGAAKPSPKALSSRVALVSATLPPGARARGRLARRRHLGVERFAAAPSTLSASGGEVHLQAVVRGATKCRFWSSRTLEGLPTTKGCTSGRASVNATLPANTTFSTKIYGFSLTASRVGATSITRRVIVLERAPVRSGVGPVAPVITMQPASQTAPFGATVTLTAAASGSPAPRAQWQVYTNAGGSWAWENVPGATSTSYSLMAETGSWRAVFTNSAGSAITTAAEVTVSLAAPVITTQPTNLTVVSGQDATFTADASGDPTPTIQWQYSLDAGSTWANLAGATAASITYTVNPSNSGSQYRAVFTNIAGSATTNPAVLTVASAPTVATEPASQTVVSGQTATFTAAASGNPTPSVQWQVFTNGSSGWGSVPGANSTSYAVAAGASDSGNEYRAVFTNIAGSATTSAATLTLATAPQITTQPANLSAMGDQDATFTAAASGDPAPGVQWQYSTDGGISWGNVAGATSTSYSLLVSAIDSGYQYRAVFTNAAGSATTNVVTLTVPPDSYPSQSGYFEYALPLPSATFSEMEASWTVPVVSCPPGANTWAAEWPGIGWNGTVVQDGTQVACNAGSPSYEAWYELVGDSNVNGGSAVTLSAAQYPVYPHDAITASVSIADSEWTLEITDTTQGWAFTFNTPNTSPGLNQGSAEIVVEGPSPGGAYGLADFGAVDFTGATAELDDLAGPIPAFSPIALAMTNSPIAFGTTNGYMLRAAAGPLSAEGNFTDTWYAN